MNTDEPNYRQFIIDDYDSSDAETETIDTEWITEYETKIMTDDYQLFLKTDITQVGFEIFYLDRDKGCVERIIPMTYTLRHPNQITQNEIFSVVQSHQRVDKKYYNFQSLLLYDFQMPENDDNDVRWVSEYLSSSSGGGDGVEYGRVIEYTNLLSFEMIYFRPLIAMFHDLVGFTVVLYED